MYLGLVVVVGEEEAEEEAEERGGFPMMAAWLGRAWRK